MNIHAHRTTSFYVYKPIARVDVDDIAFFSSLFSDKVDNTDGLSCRWIHLAAWFKAHFLTHIYSVGRHSRRSSSSRNRMGKPYAAHLARFGVYGRFAPWTFRPFTGRFAPWTFRPLDVSPPGCFAPWTFRPRLWSFRPRQWTVRVRPRL